jgi:hypothetical protein
LTCQARCRRPSLATVAGAATSKMRCVDMAALFAAAILRRNPDNIVIPFDDRAHEARVDANDTILSRAERPARYGGGGTNCALPLQVANTTYRSRRFDGVVLVSDPENWIGTGRHGSTGVMTEWQTFVANYTIVGPAARSGLERGRSWSASTCSRTPQLSQAPDRSDILNVGGFSDAVFSVVAAFLTEDAGRFLAEVEAIESWMQNAPGTRISPRGVRVVLSMLDSLTNGSQPHAIQDGRISELPSHCEEVVRGMCPPVRAYGRPRLRGLGRLHLVGVDVVTSEADVAISRATGVFGLLVRTPQSDKIGVLLTGIHPKSLLAQVGG